MSNAQGGAAPQSTSTDDAGSGLPDAVRAAQIEEEFSGSRRTLAGWQANLLTLLCVGFTLFHLFVLNVYSLEPLLFRAAPADVDGAARSAS